MVNIWHQYLLTTKQKMYNSSTHSSRHVQKALPIPSWSTTMNPPGESLIFTEQAFWGKNIFCLPTQYFHTGSYRLLLLPSHSGYLQFPNNLWNTLPKRPSCHCELCSWCQMPTTWSKAGAKPAMQAMLNIQLAITSERMDFLGQVSSAERTFIDHAEKSAR